MSDGSPSASEGLALRLARNIDRTLARTSMIAGGAPSTALLSEFDELHVPLSESVSFRELIHDETEGRVEASKQNADIKEKIAEVDTQLLDRRERLSYMLEFLGFSNWRKDLKELQQEKGLDPEKAGLSLIEELIETKIKEPDLSSEEGVEDFRAQRFGGVMSNLQGSMEALEKAETKWVPSFCSISYWTGHTGAMKDQVALEKKNVRETFASIKGVCKEIRSAAKDISEVVTKNEEREVLFEKAISSYEQGNSVAATRFAEQANTVLSEMDDSLSRAQLSLRLYEVNNGRIMKSRFSVDYQAQQERYGDMQETWADVDANYSNVLIYGDAIARGALMAVAVGAGMLVTAGTFGLGAPLTALLVTTLVGGGGIGLYNVARGVSSAAHGQEFSWEEAGLDTLNATKESALMGAGGMLLRGVTWAVGGLRIAAGLSGAGRTVQATGVLGRSMQGASRMASSGSSAVIMQTPSTAYHAYQDFNSHYQKVCAELEDDVLSDREKQYLVDKFRLPFRMTPDGRIVGADTGVEFTAEDFANLTLTEADKQNLLWHLGVGSAIDVFQCHRDDLQMSFLCGSAGHFFQASRIKAMTRMRPKVPVTPGAPGAATANSSALRRTADTLGRIATSPGSVLVYAKSQLFETYLSIISADRNLALREEYLGEEITAETRARAYGMALSGQMVGNIQADLGHSKQVQSQHLLEQTSAEATASVRQNAEVDGARTRADDMEIHTVFGDAPANGDGRHYISLGTTDVDGKRARRAMPLWREDIRLKARDQDTGGGVSKLTKEAEAEVAAVIDRMKSEGTLPDKFYETFAKNLQEKLARSALRETALKSPDEGASAAEKTAYESKIKQRAEALAAEAEFTFGRYNRGEGRDKQSIKTAVGNSLKKIKDAPASAWSWAAKKSPTLDAGGRLLSAAIRRPARGVAAIGRRVVNLPVIREVTGAVYSFVKQGAVVFPLMQGLHQYAAPGAAHLFGGVGGLGGFLIVTSKAANFLGWKMTNALNIRQPRALDASDALASKMDIESTLRHAEKLRKMDPSKALSDKQVKSLQKQLTKLDKMYSRCSQKGFGSPFTLFGLASFGAATGFTLPLIGYLGYKGLSPRRGLASTLGIAASLTAASSFVPAALAGPTVPLAFLGFKALQWSTGSKRPWASAAAPFQRAYSGAFHGAYSLLAHKHPLGAVTKTATGVLRGDNRFMQEIPILGSLYRTTGGAVFRNLITRPTDFVATKAKQHSDSVHPDGLVSAKFAGLDPALAPDLQAAYRRTLARVENYDHQTLIRQLEGRLTSRLQEPLAGGSPAPAPSGPIHLKPHDVEVTPGAYDRDVEVLLREVSPRLQEEIIERLNTTARLLTSDPRTDRIRELTDTVRQTGLSLNERQSLRNEIAEKIREDMRAASLSSESTYSLARRQMLDVSQSHLRAFTTDVTSAGRASRLDSAKAVEALTVIAELQGSKAARSKLFGDKKATPPTLGIDRAIKDRISQLKKSSASGSSRVKDLVTKLGDVRKELADAVDNSGSLDRVKRDAMKIVEVQSGSSSPMGRGDLVSRIDALHQFLKNSGLSHDDQVRVLTHVQQEIPARNKKELESRVDTLLSDFATGAPSSSQTSFQRDGDFLSNRRLRKLARKVRQGAQFERDASGAIAVDKNNNAKYDFKTSEAVRALIENPADPNPLGADTGRFAWGFWSATRAPKIPSYVRRAASRCNEMGIQSRADVETTIKGLLDGTLPRARARSLGWEARSEAARANDPLLPRNSRIIAHQNLRRLLSSHLETVETHFKKVETEADAAKKKFTKYYEQVHKLESADFANLTQQEILLRSVHRKLNSERGVVPTIRANNPASIHSTRVPAVESIWNFEPEAAAYSGMDYAARHRDHQSTSTEWYDRP